MRAFPDYGKAPDGYLLSVSELLSGYSENVRRRLCDLRTGIPSRTSYLPTIEQITKLANVYVDEELVARKYAAIKANTHPQLPGARTRPIPFPRLWDEFGDDYLRGRTFEVLFEASRRLATRGASEAREYLDEHQRSQP